MRELVDWLVLRDSTALKNAPAFLRLGYLLALEKQSDDPLARRRFVEVRQESRQASVTLWSDLLAGGISSDDQELIAKLVRYQMAMFSGVFIGLCGNPDWNADVVMGDVAAGMYAALREAHQAVT